MEKGKKGWEPGRFFCFKVPSPQVVWLKLTAGLSSPSFAAMKGLDKVDRSLDVASDLSPAKGRGDETRNAVLNIRDDTARAVC